MWQSSVILCWVALSLFTIQIVAQTPCELYSAQPSFGGNSFTSLVQNETNVMVAIITRAFTGCSVCSPVVSGWVNASSPIASFFNTEILDSGSRQLMISHMVDIIGAGWGCQALGFPVTTFTSPWNEDMGLVHQYMNINQAEFTYFQQQIALSLMSYGVDATSGLDMITILRRYGRDSSQAICTAPDCAWSNTTIFPWDTDATTAPITNMNETIFYPFENPVASGPNNSITQGVLIMIIVIGTFVFVVVIAGIGYVCYLSTPAGQGYIATEPTQKNMNIQASMSRRDVSSTSKTSYNYNSAPISIVQRKNNAPSSKTVTTFQF